MKGASTSRVNLRGDLNVIGGQPSQWLGQGREGILVHVWGPVTRTAVKCRCVTGLLLGREEYSSKGTQALCFNLLLYTDPCEL